MQTRISRDRRGHAAGAKHQYDGKDFGVDTAEIDRHFGDYIARYTIALER